MYIVILIFQVCEVYPKSKNVETMRWILLCKYSEQTTCNVLDRKRQNYFMNKSEQ